MTVRARAALLDQDLQFTVGERELPDPVAGEALVAVEWAGVCGSDLHVLRSGDWVRYWPATLGHELFGRVAACPGDPLPEGTPVVADSRVACGACPGCGRGAQLCEHLGWVGEVFPGGFATHCVVPVELLRPVPEELAGPLAALAEPLAVVLHGLSRAIAGAGWWPASDPSGDPAAAMGRARGGSGRGTVPPEPPDRVLLSATGRSAPSPTSRPRGAGPALS